MKLDLVGAAEAARLLGVETPRITRWRKSGRLPPPALELRATPVWHRRDIERLADGDVNGRRGAQLADEHGPLVLGVAEVAALLGKDKSQIGRWRRAGKFPAPVAELASGPLWLRDDIEGFSRPAST